MKKRAIFVLLTLVLFSLTFSACAGSLPAEAQPLPSLESIATEGLDVQLLLRANFSDARHLLGNVVEEYQTLRRVYLFDTGIVVTVTNGRISNISFNYDFMDEEARSQIHFNALHAGSTSADVRSIFGEPYEEGDGGYYVYRDRRRSTLLVVRFGADGKFSGVGYMTMP